MIASFYAGLAVGFLLGCLVLLAIITKPRKVPRAIVVVGSDVTVPRSASMATAYREGWRAERESRL